MNQQESPERDPESQPVTGRGGRGVASVVPHLKKQQQQQPQPGPSFEDSEHASKDR